YTGTTYVNGGTLRLNSGVDNTLPALPGATVPTLAGLFVNGTGIVDLNGHNQAVGAFGSNDPIAGTGGIGTSATAADFTAVIAGADRTFAGAITGAISFAKYGANNLILTSDNSYSGTTIVGGGTLTLRDSGVLSKTTDILVSGGILAVDQAGLNTE